ncbi:MAG: acyl-CoA/acyl-ACP dehydrogenase [Spirochaetes bacterium]|nr:acyl-CoA/acyl-ACP dehydrogenase [Spirochaetota bacterium]
MKSIDDFSRPLNNVSPMERPFRKVLRRVVDDEIMPHRRKYDEDWENHEYIEPVIHKLCVGLGIQKALFPQEYGGWSLGQSDYMMALAYCIAEEVGRGDSALSLSSICSLWPVCTFLIPPLVNMDLARELAPMFTGEALCIGCQAMTEPQGGSDIENMDLIKGKTITTTARQDGDHWVINGHKLWPTNSGGIATIFGVPCTTRPGSEDPNDFAYIMVPADTEGVTQSPPYAKAGMAADKNGDIWFENARVPLSYRIHGPGKDALAFKGLIYMGQLGSVGFAVGALMNVYEILYEFASTRTFGNRLLKENDAIAGILGDIAGSIDICRVLAYEVVRLGDDRNKPWGNPIYSEETIAKSRNIKEFICDKAVDVCGKAMDILGTHGSDRAWDVEKHWRDLKMVQLWLGGKQLCQMEKARYYFNCTTL